MEKKAVVLPIYAMIIYFTFINFFKIDHNSMIYNLYLVIIAVYCLLVFLISLKNYRLNSNSLFVLLLPIVFGLFLSISNMYYFNLDLENTLFQVFFIQCLPSYYMGSLIRRKDYSWYFYKTSDYINYISTLVLFLFFLTGTRNQFGLYSSFGETGYQFIGYTSTLFFIYNFSYFMQVLDKKIKVKIVSLIIRMILMVIQLVLVISSGTRGSFVVILATIAIVLLEKFNKRNIFISAIILFVFIIVIKYPSSDSVNSGLLRFFSTFDTNEGLVNWEVSGRTDVYTSAINLIKQNPINGVGPLGYQFFTGNVYPHNIFLDVTTSFGIFGLILFILMLINIFMNARKSRGYDKYIYMIFLYSIVNLLFSSSYVSNYYFWFSIGYWLTPISKKNKNLYP